MKTLMKLKLGILVIGTLALTSTLTQAQTVANGPYYATPSWNQKLQCDTAASCPRFIVLANWDSKAVLDRETGLVWERNPSTAGFTWNSAVGRCNRLNVGNRFGWRLPSLQELSSLFDSGAASPRLPSGHPFTPRILNNFYYWTTTPDLFPFTANLNLVNTVNFDGQIFGRLGKTA